jgi:hypothetical protein
MVGLAVGFIDEQGTVFYFHPQRVKRSVDGMVVGRDAGADTKSKSAETPDGDVTHAWSPTY